MPERGQASAGAVSQHLHRIFLGWDQRESLCYWVAEHSLRSRSRALLDIEPLRLNELERHDLSRRKYTRKGGQLFDEVSKAPCSTEFANTRFLVPKLAMHGWALFMDSDIVALGDIEELFDLADRRFAVMCIKHDSHPVQYKNATKMDGQIQTNYYRKNWSSVVLWNCDHRAHAGLTMDDLNTRRGRDLHAFFWLDDEQIGELPPAWNWLVGVNPCPPTPKIAHFTLGGPWLPGWTPREHDDKWLHAEADYRAHCGAGEPDRG